jgi:NhaP-type Na+/H+ or K+/H+ antiporter
LPVVWLLRRWIGPFRSTRAALFAGWFGPIGVAALFYGTYASRHLPAYEATIWPVVSLVIVASTVVHGVSATPFINLYSRASQGDGVAGGGSHRR